SLFSSYLPASTAISTLSLHDALPICPLGGITRLYARARRVILSISTITSRLCSTSRMALSSTSSETLIWLSGTSSKVELTTSTRSEEHTSELQSRFDLVCRLLLEKNK